MTIKDRPYKSVIERGRDERNDAKHAFIVERLSALKPRRWLDIGCNTGWLLGDVPGGEGVDSCLVMVDRARAKGLKARHAIAEQLPFELGAFDVAVLASTLHLIEDWQQAIAEASRVAHTVIGTSEYPGTPWGTLGGEHKSVKAVINPDDFWQIGGVIERINDYSYFFTL